MGWLEWFGRMGWLGCEGKLGRLRCGCEGRWLVGCEDG